MRSITFIDIETDSQGKKIQDFGAIKLNESSMHKAVMYDFLSFIEGSEYLCGHNIIDFDIPIIEKATAKDIQSQYELIDTLYLSPLLFPQKPYHHLVKDDKLDEDVHNNPLIDSKKARSLFLDEVSAFSSLDERLKVIFYHLLSDSIYFKSFFHFIGYEQNRVNSSSLEQLIKTFFIGRICNNSNLLRAIEENPVALAYCLSLINSDDRYSLTPRWVLSKYPQVERIMYTLRSQPCLAGCEYCDQNLDAARNLKKYYNFPGFREFEGVPLQENAVNAAIQNKSLLVIFPTGGGKSLTFQLPALIAGEHSRALTVVISPLQSLMKDQVDNLSNAGITDAVTINGLLDPIERSNAIDRIEGVKPDTQLANILYISPESLRSKTIERLLAGRKIARFVIDEAHCFSSWGHDFRVDYLYIGKFIKNLQEKKRLEEPIPVSCFTATAKIQVIEDIITYFREELDLRLGLFQTKASRENLNYEVIPCKDEDYKYDRLRSLIFMKECPTIVYVSRTKKTELIVERLVNDGINAAPFHGQMETKQKQENQNAFIDGTLEVMVATSAFGMGVDKKDVGLVVHYDVSDSLENYVQEAGRAGRDEKVTADCYVLYNEDDLDKHFMLFNRSRLGIQEIQQVWRAVKDLTRLQKAKYQASKSALEIARKAGWDENIQDVETRVKTAISAL